MPIRKIPHEFRKEMILPWGAIPDNISMISESKTVLETSDGRLCTIRSWKEIHMLSPEAADLISALYNVNIMQFLRAWYKKLPFMSSMFLIHIIIDEENNADAQGLSEKDNRADDGEPAKK